MGFSLVLLGSFAIFLPPFRANGREFEPFLWTEDSSSSPPSPVEVWEFLVDAASAFSPTRRTPTFLHLWFSSSHLGLRGTPDYPDGILRRFLRHRFDERYGFVFRIEHLILFWLFGTDPETFLSPYFLMDFLDSSPLLEFYLRTQVSDFGDQGVD